MAGVSCPPDSFLKGFLNFGCVSSLPSLKFKLSHVLIIKKINRFLLIILWWKLKTLFIGTFTFILAYVRDIIILLSTGASLKSSSVMSAWTDAQYYSFSFFIASLAIGKLISLLPARPGEKINLHLPAQPGPLEKLPVICPPVGQAQARTDLWCTVQLLIYYYSLIDFFFPNRDLSLKGTNYWFSIFKM